MRMTYNEAKKHVFAVGEIPDGYNGDIQRVEFARDHDGTILVIHDSGYFNSGLPLAQTDKEAYYLLREHPDSRARKVFRTTLDDLYNGL